MDRPTGTGPGIRAETDADLARIDTARGHYGIPADMALTRAEDAANPVRGMPRHRHYWARFWRATGRVVIASGCSLVPECVAETYRNAHPGPAPEGPDTDQDGRELFPPDPHLPADLQDGLAGYADDIASGYLMCSPHGHVHPREDACARDGCTPCRDQPGEDDSHGTIMLSNEGESS